MSIVAVIPARGGSKGIPGKNLRPVAGIPLVVRTIEAARSCGLIDRIVVSTDDPAIADVALAAEAEAEVVDHPAHLSGDRATSESAVLHALEHIDPVAEIVVFLQPTSPFVDSAALCEAIERVRSGLEDVVFSAVETFTFLWRLDVEGRATGVNHDPSARSRRRDREPHFPETGGFYVMRAAGFSRARFRFFGRVGVAIVDERTSIEIDTLDQLSLANAIASLVGTTSSHRPSPSPQLEHS
jgi:CMP-N-acetylneuraminic acid synthetase